jgi:hypothetical protein
VHEHPAASPRKAKSAAPTAPRNNAAVERTVRWGESEEWGGETARELEEEGEGGPDSEAGNAPPIRPAHDEAELRPLLARRAARRAAQVKPTGKALGCRQGRDGVEGDDAHWAQVAANAAKQGQEEGEEKEEEREEGGGEGEE